MCVCCKVKKKKKKLHPVGLEPTASELEVRRAAIAPRVLLSKVNVKNCDNFTHLLLLWLTVSFQS